MKLEKRVKQINLYLNEAWKNGDTNTDVHHNHHKQIEGLGETNTDVPSWSLKKNKNKIIP